MDLDNYADYLRKAETRTESRAVRALVTTGGTRTMKLHGRYIKVYVPNQVMLNVDGTSTYSTYTETYLTINNDQEELIYSSQ